MTARLFVFGGPNGAGKSTLVARFVRGQLPVVNPDDLAQTLPAGGTALARSVQAGRLAVAERADHLAARRSFAVETTLTGHSELELMRRARGAGYRINLIFVGLDDVSLSVARVATRVGAGGHDVPLDDIYRRYSRCMGNLPAALGLADRALVLDNSGDQRRVLLYREAGAVRRVSQHLPEWAQHAIPVRFRQQASPSGVHQSAEINRPRPRSR